MRPQDRVVARRQLDKRLILLDKFDSYFARPTRGWVRAIREALGMTAAQLGERLGVSQQRALAVEKAEVNSSITLESLQRAAQALNCHLVYALVPRNSLETIVEERARALAKKRLTLTRHTMALEDQTVEESDERAQMERLTRTLIEKSGSVLWDEQ